MMDPVVKMLVVVFRGRVDIITQLRLQRFNKPY